MTCLEAVVLVWKDEAFGMEGSGDYPQKRNVYTLLHVNGSNGKSNVISILSQLVKENVKDTNRSS